MERYDASGNPTENGEYDASGNHIGPASGSGVDGSGKEKAKPGIDLDKILGTEAIDKMVDENGIPDEHKYHFKFGLGFFHTWLEDVLPMSVVERDTATQHADQLLEIFKDAVIAEHGVEFFFYVVAMVTEMGVPRTVFNVGLDTLPRPSVRYDVQKLIINLINEVEPDYDEKKFAEMEVYLGKEGVANLAKLFKNH